MTFLRQQEFDELHGIIVHILVDDTLPSRSLCSGEIIDPQRWSDNTTTVRKQCQACLRAARRVVETPTVGSSESFR